MSGPLPLPAAGSRYQGVNTGEGYPSRSHEVHYSLVVEETIEEIELRSGDCQRCYQSEEIVFDVDETGGTWVREEVHARVVKLRQKTKKDKRVPKVCRVLINFYDIIYLLLTAKYLFTLICSIFVEKNHPSSPKDSEENDVIAFRKG